MTARGNPPASRQERVDPPFHFSREGLETGRSLPKPSPSIRTGARNRLPWVKATAHKKTLEEKAVHYLEIFNHDTPFRREMPEMTLAKVVCNLRNYYQQDAEATLRLIQSLYNGKCGYEWTPEGIRLAWELSEPYTPSLGLADEDAQSKMRVAEIEGEMADILAYTRSGGRVSLPDLFALFREWYPEREVENEVLGKTVNAITGIRSKPSNSVRYYYGFHLPTPEELLDPAHTVGDSLPKEAEFMSAIRSLVDDYHARQYRNRVAC